MPLIISVLAACGSQAEEKVLDPVEETRVSLHVVGGKAGVNTVLSEDRRTVRYLGRIENTGIRPFCGIEIGFLALDGQGAPIQTALSLAKLYGRTMTVVREGDPMKHQERDDCLRPGDRGVFDYGPVALTEEFGDLEFRICPREDADYCDVYEPGEVADPRAPLEWILMLIGPSQDGMASFRGRVRNNLDDNRAIPYDIQVHYAIFDQDGGIIDSALSPRLRARAQPCPDFDIIAVNPEGCLTKGVSTDDFTVESGVLFEDYCPGCNEHRIFRKECILEGDSCPE